MFIVRIRTKSRVKRMEAKAMENTNLRLMENGPISKTILKLAIPTVLSTIISIIYNITDTYFIGMLDDPVQLGAISLAFPVFMVLQALGNLFGVGAPPYISRMLGAGDLEEVKRTSSVAVYFSTALILFLSLLCFIFMNPILHIIGTSTDTFGPTKKYLSIVIAFSTVIILQSLLPALLRAEGKVREAVIGMVLGTVINIILDPVFILFFHMGVSGAAWATVIGNVIAVLFYLFVFLKGNTLLSVNPHDFKLSGKMFREVLKIGIPSSVSLVLTSATTAMFNNLAVKYGDYVVPVYMGAFSTNSQIIAIGTQFLRVQAWAVPIMGVQTCIMTTFQATGQGVRALIVSLGRQCLFYIPVLYLFNTLWGLNGLLCVQMTSDWLTVIVAVTIAIPLLLRLRGMTGQNPEKIARHDDTTHLTGEV
ncbi:MAG TPA: hypothetical protein DDY31_00065 [Lachnospiraceae bacterium]|nr:hypothetical protein [Lachnospiraceae bacterium]